MARINWRLVRDIAAITFVVLAILLGDNITGH